VPGGNPRSSRLAPHAPTTTGERKQNRKPLLLAICSIDVAVNGLVTETETMRVLTRKSAGDLLG
jgi:hypothetical protein